MSKRNENLAIDMTILKFRENIANGMKVCQSNQIAAKCLKILSLLSSFDCSFGKEFSNHSEGLHFATKDLKKS